MMRRIAVPGLAIACAACAAGGGYGAPATGTEPAAKPEEGSCDASAAQRYVGKPASVEAGSAILGESGARTLRWGPPRSVWTMDFRRDRVNVRYDDDMIITDVTCG